MKRLALFPFDRSVSVLVKYKDLLKGYNLTMVLVPAYMNLAGRSIDYIDGGTSDLIFYDYHDEMLAKCDVLYVFYSNYIRDLDIYKCTINAAKSRNKEVVISKELASKLIGFEEHTDDMNFDVVEKNKLFNINIPVVTVLSQGKYCDQSYTEVLLSEYFKREGYKVSTIGSEDYSMFFGYKKTPDFIYQQIDGERKACMYNRYAHNCVLESSSDILITGVPGGIMKYNNQVLNGLGVTPYIIMNALMSDISVVNLYFGDFDEDYLINISNILKYRYNSPSVYYNTANTAVRYSELYNELDYIMLDSKFTAKKMNFEIPEREHKLFNAFDPASSEKVFEAIKSELQDNVGIIR